jgi:hypothetical protein
MELVLKYSIQFLMLSTLYEFLSVMMIVKFVHRILFMHLHHCQVSYRDNQTYYIVYWKYSFDFQLGPETKPILDIDHPIYVSNNSVYVKCNVDQKECSKLNGFFSKFYFVLKVHFVNTIVKLRLYYINIYRTKIKWSYERMKQKKIIFTLII